MASISDFDNDLSTRCMASITIPKFTEVTQVMTIDGWMVIFQKVDTNTSFHRPWDDYVNGFGTYDYNFWMGLEKIHQLTSTGTYSMKLEVLLQNGIKLLAEYASFQLSDRSYQYYISVSGFSGTDGDIMTDGTYTDGFNGMKFSTYDSDNDQCGSNCGSRCDMGWWYNHCCLWPTADFYIPLYTSSPVSTARMMIKLA